MSKLFKRRTILQTLVGSLIALFGGEAIAAVGPTLQCTRVGQKIVYRGFTYSCIKSKGNLVWKKGAMVPVVKSTPTPTPTPTPTASATPTPTPTPTPTASASATPTPTASATPTPTPTPTPTASASATPTPTPTSKGVVIAQSSQINEGSVKIIQARDNNGTSQIYAISRFSGNVRVMSSSCTHQGCTVASMGANLNCACHGSQFSGLDGAVQQGPAGRALTIFRSLEENGEIILLK